MRILSGAWKCRNVGCDAPVGTVFPVAQLYSRRVDAPVGRPSPSATSASCRRHRRPPCLQSFHRSCLCHGVRVAASRFESCAKTHLSRLPLRLFTLQVMWNRSVNDVAEYRVWAAWWVRWWRRVLGQVVDPPAMGSRVSSEAGCTAGAASKAERKRKRGVGIARDSCKWSLVLEGVDRRGLGSGMLCRCISRSSLM